MKSIGFYGAAGMVTGSNFLLTDSSENKILIDLGMFQGTREINDLNYEALKYSPKDIHSLLLTHAHLDHCGRLPLLARGEFSGKIYMTQATRDLVEVVLYDSAKINQRDTHKELLYTSNDVDNILKHMEVIQYHEPFSINSLKIEYIDAGHILGSASIKVTDTQSNKIFAFSGDLGNTPEEIVRPTEYFDSANYALVESTYGDRVHPEEKPDEVLAKEINTIETTGGTLLIPAFSLERTQVILHKIDHLKKQNRVKNETKIYMDSPMGEKATKIYASHYELYNQKLAEHQKQDKPFEFPGLVIVQDAKHSKKIKQDSGPKVIIAGSGMMSGGRILNHAIDFLPRDDTRLLIVGFQAVGTVGRQIEEGAKSVKIEGHTVAVKAAVNALHSMSAHADQPRLIEWVRHIKGVEKLFLIHGEDGPREELKSKINQENLAQQIHMPHLYQEYEL